MAPPHIATATRLIESEITVSWGSPASAVRTILERPDEELDYARAAVAIDRLVDPDVDARRAFAKLDQLTEWAVHLSSYLVNEETSLSALRTILYRSGPWNGYRPFAYDHVNFRSVRFHLISRYLETRRGNCVSMPILFLILADRLGLDIGLALAPCHLFLRYRDRSGPEINLEATSGALPARDDWLRQERRISDRSIKSGLYLRKLSRRESVAAMALTLVEHLMKWGRYEEALEVAQVIVDHSPRNALAMAHQGQACFNLLKSRFLDRYRSPLLIPPLLRKDYSQLLDRNRAAFAAAQALGWEPIHPGS